jgi:hypothetical protein
MLDFYGEIGEFSGMGIDTNEFRAEIIQMLERGKKNNEHNRRQGSQVGKTLPGRALEGADR